MSQLEDLSSLVVRRHFGIGETTRPLHVIAAQTGQDAHFVRMIEKNALTRIAREASNERTGK